MIREDERPSIGPNQTDAEQYALLQRCADAGDASAWNDWRRENPDAPVRLQGVELGSGEQRVLLRRIDLHDADLARAKLGFVVLVGADLRGANLTGATLRKAILVRADLRDARLQETDLAGANLHESDLRGATCAYAKVDGETLLRSDRIDRRTDFTGVAIDNARTDPGLKQLLTYIVRRDRWRQWYREHRLLAAPAWLFWQTSDYGRSTWRIILAFAVLALGFAVAYTLLPGCVSAVWAKEPGQQLGLGHALYFSIVTMTTLGYGDLYASPESGLGQFLLSFQVILGYVLLGALITRLAVLFTSGGPSSSFYREPR
jgi:hypothetical protein